MLRQEWSDDYDWFSEAVGIEPKWFARPATKPGYGDPEPLKPVPPYDTQENIDTCLSCLVEGGCNPTNKACPLYGKSKRAQRRRRKREAIFCG